MTPACRAILLMLAAATAPAAPPTLIDGAQRPLSLRADSGRALDLADVPAQVLAAAGARLSERLAVDGVDAAATLLSAEAVIWRDGSLGCPGREPRTMALVPGYRLAYRAGGQRFEIHAAASGRAVACDRAPPVAVPAGR